jgi:hypothetical protein
MIDGLQNFVSIPDRERGAEWSSESPTEKSPRISCDWSSNPTPNLDLAERFRLEDPISLPTPGVFMQWWLKYRDKFITILWTFFGIQPKTSWTSDDYANHCTTEAALILISHYLSGLHGLLWG